jgi:hypothetical protein
MIYAFGRGEKQVGLSWIYGTVSDTIHYTHTCVTRTKDIVLCLVSAQFKIAGRSTEDCPQKRQADRGELRHVVGHERATESHRCETGEALRDIDLDKEKGHEY